MPEERELAGVVLDARLVARAGALLTLEDEELETLDDFRSGSFGFSRVEESEDLSRVGEPEVLSLVDSFLPESPEFR